MISELRVLFPDTSECFISVKVSQEVLPLYWIHGVLQKRKQALQAWNHMKMSKRWLNFISGWTNPLIQF